MVRTEKFKLIRTNGQEMGEFFVLRDFLLNHIEFHKVSTHRTLLYQGINPIVQKDGFILSVRTGLSTSIVQ